MRITYITHTRFPVQKAHGKQIAEVCSALAGLGHTVELLCPTVTNSISKDPFSYYSIPKNFSVRFLKHFDATAHRVVPGVFHMRVNMWRYGKALREFLAGHKTDLLYVRTPFLLPVLLATKRPVIFEVHTLPRWRKKRFRALLNACARVVCLTQGQRTELLRWGVHGKGIVVEPDGVDLKRFKKVVLKRHASGFRDDVPVVGYIGSFTTQKKIEKGIPLILDAVSILRSEGVRAHAMLAGGTQEEVEAARAHARSLQIDDDVLVHPHMRASEVPMQILACDLLVYPAPASCHPYFQRDTSPLKLFEYLASGRPIICADLPPLREVVGKEEVYFFTPGDRVSLAHWIRYALEHPKEASARAKAGLQKVTRFSWEKRMERVLLGIQRKSRK